MREMADKVDNGAARAWLDRYIAGQAEANYGFGCLTPNKIADVMSSFAERSNATTMSPSVLQQLINYADAIRFSHHHPDCPAVHVPGDSFCRCHVKHATEMLGILKTLSTCSERTGNTKL